MDLKFLHSIIFVKDLAVSRAFYTQVLDLKIVQEYPTFILFENNFAIHITRELLQTIFGQDPGETTALQGKNNILLYFESPNLEDVFNRIQSQVTLIHPITRQHWGQRVFRFYDPDQHIIEIGEPM
jgi:catechol 2,3-dioxygenase-like lactoylglutathione lyase family enzyme